MPIYLWNVHYIKMSSVHCPSICLKQCIMKVFTIISWIEVWYSSPWIHEKYKILVLHVYSRGKLPNFKSRKNKENLFLVLFIYRIYYFDTIICTRYNFFFSFLKNACNLWHSNIQQLLLPVECVVTGERE